MLDEDESAILKNRRLMTCEEKYAAGQAVYSPCRPRVRRQNDRALGT